MIDWKKHKGMRISASGLLGRIRDKWKVEDHQRYVAGELLRHLEELAKRFYKGDTGAVDEFLQLYDLDDTRPETYKQWRESADLIHVGEIFSCPECGDSGLTRKVTCPECGSLFGHKPTCHGKGVDYHDHAEPCSCRKNKTSLWSIRERVKG